jgi:hypothetical protein
LIRGTEAIWLDATDSTYFMPGLRRVLSGLITGDVLTQDAASTSWSRCSVTVRTQQRSGIFWFGAVPGTSRESRIPERLLRRLYDPFDGGVSGLNVTITGLPRMTGGAPGLDRRSWPERDCSGCWR